MARVPNKRSDTELARNIAADMRTNAGITHWAVDSMGRILAEAVSQELARANAEDRRSFDSYQLTQAEGKELDDLSLTIGGPKRRSASTASVETFHRNLYFYTEAGTFGDINGGADIIVPANTIIRTRREGRPDIAEYRTSESFTLGSDTSLAYLSAKAVTMGSGLNVAENTLRYHTFTNYTESAKELLKVNNDFPILDGTDREDDDRYRYRLFQNFPALVKNNTANIRLQGLGLPGVEQVRILPGYFGIGTAAVIVFGIDNETTYALTESLFDKLREIQGPGLKVVPIAGVKVYFDFDVRVLLQNTLSVADQSSLTKTIKQIILQNIKLQEYSRTISFAPMASSIVRDNSIITGLLGRDRSIPSFETIYYRKAPSDTQPIEERLLIVSNSFTLEDEEHSGLGRVSIQYQTKV